ncbi:MAG: DUF2807 domain-containing protein [Dehalococcoidales bacterium]|nr:DUF2807 domain-containing protein [Dehalococcoidales bacterium]
MKRILISLLAVIFILSSIITGCGGETAGSGKLTTESYDYTDFTLIEAVKGFELTVKQSQSYKIEITTDDNIRKYLDINKTGNILKIGLSGGHIDLTTLRVELSMPGIEGINLSGGASATITGFNSDKSFSVTLTGGSVLTGDIISGDAGFGISGGSVVTLSGSGKDLMVRSSDGSELTLDEFPVNNADINIDGGGRSFFNIKGKLDTVLTGGSELYYTGDPEMGEVNISSGSVLEKR